MREKKYSIKFKMFFFGDIYIIKISMNQNDNINLAYTHAHKVLSSKYIRKTF